MTGTDDPQHVQLGPARIDALTFQQAVQRVCDLARAGGPRRYVVTPNIQHIALLRRDAAFAQAYDAAELVLPDGFPICLAMRAVLGRRQPRITGADLVPAVCQEAARRGLSVGLLGGQPGATEEAARRLRSAFPDLGIVLVEPAPLGFDRAPTELARVVQGVAAAAPDVLFVGLGAPKGELFLFCEAERLGSGVGLSVGAAVDFEAGRVPRAPRTWQHLGLEWLWRIRQEPRRLVGRYLRSAPLFLLTVAPSVLRGVLRRRRRST